jgi:hypothetical protein
MCNLTHKKSRQSPVLTIDISIVLSENAYQQPLFKKWGEKPQIEKTEMAATAISLKINSYLQR